MCEERLILAGAGTTTPQAAFAPRWFSESRREFGLTARVAGVPGSMLVIEPSFGRKGPMPKVACIVRSGLVLAAVLALAPPAGRAAELACADQPVTARGPSFTPSPEQSMEAAEKEWLTKATTIYSDAKLETAKDPQMSCVNQGLYSNCTISAVPCGSALAAKPN